MYVKYLQKVIRGEHRNLHTLFAIHMHVKLLILRPNLHIMELLRTQLFLQTQHHIKTNSTEITIHDEIVVSSYCIITNYCQGTLFLEIASRL